MMSTVQVNPFPAEYSVGPILQSWPTRCCPSSCRHRLFTAPVGCMGLLTLTGLADLVVLQPEQLATTLHWLEQAWLQMPKIRGFEF